MQEGFAEFGVLSAECGVEKKILRGKIFIYKHRRGGVGFIRGEWGRNRPLRQPLGAGDGQAGTLCIRR